MWWMRYHSFRLAPSFSREGCFSRRADRLVAPHVFILASLIDQYCFEAFFSSLCVCVCVFSEFALHKKKMHSWITVDGEREQPMG